MAETNLKPPVVINVLESLKFVRSKDDPSNIQKYCTHCVSEQDLKKLKKHIKDFTDFRTAIKVFNKRKESIEADKFRY